jgi:hypothetical protein
MSFAKGPLRCLANHGKGLRKDLLDGLASPNSLLEFSRFAPELIVAERTDFRLNLVDPFDEGLDSFQFPFILAPHDLFDQ